MNWNCLEKFYNFLSSRSYLVNIGWTMMREEALEKMMKATEVMLVSLKAYRMKALLSDWSDSFGFVNTNFENVFGIITHLISSWFPCIFLARHDSVLLDMYRKSLIFSSITKKTCLANFHANIDIFIIRRQSVTTTVTVFSILTKSD